MGEAINNDLASFLTISSLKSYIQKIKQPSMHNGGLSFTTPNEIMAQAERNT